MTPAAQNTPPPPFPKIRDDMLSRLSRQADALTSDGKTPKPAPKPARRPFLRGLN